MFVIFDRSVFGSCLVARLETKAWILWYGTSIAIASNLNGVKQAIVAFIIFWAGHKLLWYSERLSGAEYLDLCSEN